MHDRVVTQVAHQRKLLSTLIAAVRLLANVQLPVQRQRAGKREELLADVASVRLLPGVRPFVVLEVDLPDEPLAADGAHVPALLMDEQVSAEVVGGRVPLVADVAREAPVETVRHLVRAPDVLVRKAPAADAALVWLLVGVRPRVLRQRATLREPEAAFGACVRLLLRVAAHVLCQPARPDAPVAAYRALVLLLEAVLDRHVLEQTPRPAVSPTAVLA